MEKKYDQKFVFGWKDGSLDFTYEQGGKFGKGTLRKNFDFGKGEETIDTESEWVNEPKASLSPEPKLLEEKAATSVPDMGVVVPPDMGVIEPPTDPIPDMGVPEPVPGAPGTGGTPEGPPVTSPPAPGTGGEQFYMEANTGDVSGTLMKSLTDAIPVAVATDAPSEPVEAAVAPAPVVDVLVHANRNDLPTVQVRLPDVMPQVVAVDVAQINPYAPVDPLSPHAQVVVEVTDGTIAVPKDAELKVIKTPEAASDVVVAVTPKAAETATAIGLDVMDLVKKAVETADMRPDLPDLTPDEKAPVIPQVVGMTLDGTEVKLSDVSENIPQNAVILPVETPPEMPNIVVAVDPETKDKFDKFGLDPAKELGKFVGTTDTAVATVKGVAKGDVLDWNKADYVDEDSMWEPLKRWMRNRRSDE